MVIIVEEHPEACATLSRLTQRAVGGPVIGFQNYDEAYAAILRGNVQLLIVSAGDSKAQGVGLIKKVRKLEDTYQMWIVALTTQAWVEISYEALLNAGADCILTKPASWDAILDSLSKGLKLRASNDIILLSAGMESAGLDFKERIYLTSVNERASIEKDVIAMSNFGGGKIIVGVKETTSGSFEHVGIMPDELPAYETTDFMKAIRDFMQPHVPVECHSIAFDQRIFKVLNVPALDTIVMASRENAAAGLFMGRIYSRNASAESAEIRSATEMRALFDRIIRSLMKRNQ